VTCAELIDRLLDYCDGVLVEEETHQVELHLVGCPNCVVYYESYTCTVKLARKLPRCSAIPAATEARLRQALYEHFGIGNG
jgi:hypothetical protein